MGRSLVLMAKANPERNYVGIEVHVPGIAQCVYEAGMAELKIYVYSMLTQFKFYVKCLTTVSTAYNFTSQTLGKRNVISNAASLFMNVCNWLNKT